MLTVVVNSGVQAAVMGRIVLTSVETAVNVRWRKAPTYFWPSGTAIPRHHQYLHHVTAGVIAETLQDFTRRELGVPALVLTPEQSWAVEQFLGWHMGDGDGADAGCTSDSKDAPYLIIVLGIIASIDMGGVYPQLFVALLRRCHHGSANGYGLVTGNTDELVPEGQKLPPGPETASCR